MRLGLGSRQPGHVSQAAGHMEFIAALERNAPDVIEALHSDVFPSFAHVGGYLLLEWDSPQPLLQERPEELRAWAKRYRLTADWILVWAVKTLHLWHRVPSLEARRSVALAVNGWAPLPDTYLYFEGMSWEPSVEPRSEFAGRARKAFGEALREYLDRREEEAESLGWVKPDGKNDGLVGPKRPFDWLVQNIVRRETPTAISDAFMRVNPETGKPESAIEPETVRAAIVRAARVADVADLLVTESPQSA